MVHSTNVLPAANPQIDGKILNITTPVKQINQKKMDVKQLLIEYHKFLTADDEHKENIGYVDNAELFMTINDIPDVTHDMLSDDEILVKAENVKTTDVDCVRAIKYAYFLGYGACQNNYFTPPKLNDKQKEKIVSAIYCLTDDDGYPYPDKPLIKRACDYLNEFRDMMVFYPDTKPKPIEIPVTLEERINAHIKECGYTFDADHIITEYNEKYSQGIYVSFTTKAVIGHFENELQKNKENEKS